MTSQVEKMEREILSLYRQVIHQGRPNVAEHLLCALETLDHAASNQRTRTRRSAVADLIWNSRDHGRETNDNRLNLDAHDTKATILKTKPGGQNALGGPPVYRSD